MSDLYFYVHGNTVYFLNTKAIGGLRPKWTCHLKNNVCCENKDLCNGSCEFMKNYNQILEETRDSLNEK